MDSLRTANEIVIKQADKGGGIVILEKNAHVGEALRLLSNTTTY